MSVVFVVQHTHLAQDGDEEDVKMIGVFSTRQTAEQAVTRLRCERGFRDHPDGFDVVEYEIDKVHWIEGFMSWKEAVE